MYHLGFVSAIFPNKSFEEVIDFASANDFQCVEVMCWPKGKAERRYAGVTHIDVDSLDEAAINHIKNYLQERNVYISGLGYYPNPLDAGAEKREVYLSHIKKIINAAALLNVPVVNTFIGRDQYKNVTDNLEAFKIYWPPVVAYAEEKGVKIGIENCPMLFTNDEWPGGKNLAATPAIWDEMYSIITSNSFGLNFDPSHFVWQQMDYVQAIHDYKHKLFHIHLKDAKVYKDQLNKVGIMATPLQYHSPKLPGLGDVNWQAFFDALKTVNYNGPVVIEFEDKAYEGSEELIVKGMLETRDYVQKYL
ncbi:MAG: sugar phosphate isomerase/epimerase [Chitinophagaceae bacterium]|nr:sugar phosphate isomerase/epimerase [Chitinophagaceae bacterium]